MKNYSCVYSAQADVQDVKLVMVETDISNGLHSFSVIGLPDKAIEEAKDRVGAAIKNSGLTSPKTQNQKITVSLAPADIKKEGPSFDLPIAISYLLSSSQIEFDAKGICFIGELSLSGEIRRVRGVLPIALSSKKLGFHTIFVPKENELEASLVHDITVYGVENLKDIVDYLDSKNTNAKKSTLTPAEKNSIKTINPSTCLDISEIKSQESAKRALLIAAAGNHNIALYGPPGTGKTMLAKAMVGIMPELDSEKSFEVASIHSIAGILESEISSLPPFRSPHHTSSHVAIVGGGTNPKPGEITLAHNGILFMDEFPEFDKRVLESLREPLEEGSISISRARGRAIFPANFILVAALNPCPCGNNGNPNKRCVCSANEIQKYMKKISGPMTDRIDIWVEVSNISYKNLHEKSKNSNESLIYKNKIMSSRKLQLMRNKNKLNGELSSKDIDEKIFLSKDVLSTLESAATKLALSPRSYYKTIKLAQTIADIENSKSLEVQHILEALQYRPKI